MSQSATMFWLARLSMLNLPWPATPMTPMFSLSLGDRLRCCAVEVPMSPRPAALRIVCWRNLRRFCVVFIILQARRLPVPCTGNPQHSTSNIQHPTGRKALRQLSVRRSMSNVECFFSAMRDISGSQFLEADVAKGHRVVVAGKAEGAAGAILARMRAVGHELGHGERSVSRMMVPLSSTLIFEPW